MDSQVGPERMAAWEGLIRTVGALLKTFDEELQESEKLPLSWYEVLLRLDDAPEKRIRMRDLAGLIVLSRSGLTRLIDRMGSAGLVDREPSKEDRRGYYAVLTEEGRRVLGRARPIHHRGIHEHFTKHLAGRDVKALAAIVAKVRRGNQLQEAGGA